MSLGRILSACLLGTFVYLGARAVDTGVTHAWPAWARTAWAVSLAVGTIGAVILAVTGLGLLTTEDLHSSYSSDTPAERRLTSTRFLGIYVAFIALGVGVSLVFEKRLGITAHRTIFVFGGATFLLAATRWPWWLFDTFRRLGWFSDISSDRVMQVILAVLGALLVAAGFLVEG